MQDGIHDKPNKLIAAQQTSICSRSAIETLENRCPVFSKLTKRTPERCQKFHFEFEWVNFPEKCCKF